MIRPNNTRQSPGEKAMTKERKSQKESKKQPAMTLKEKRNAKKSKQDSGTFQGIGKPA
jgi:hypothetical protein